MCGIRGRRAPRRGPAGATATAGENAAAGSSQRPVGTPGLGPSLVHSAAFYVYREGKGEEGKILVAALFRSQIL